MALRWRAEWQPLQPARDAQNARRRRPSAKKSRALHPASDTPARQMEIGQSAARDDGASHRTHLPLRRRQERNSKPRGPCLCHAVSLAKRPCRATRQPVNQGGWQTSELIFSARHSLNSGLDGGVCNHEKRRSGIFLSRGASVVKHPVPGRRVSEAVQRRARRCIATR